MARNWLFLTSVRKVSTSACRGSSPRAMDFVDLVELHDLHLLVPYHGFSLKILSKAIHGKISQKMLETKQYLDVKPLFYWSRYMRVLDSTSLSRTIQPFFPNRLCREKLKGWTLREIDEEEEAQRKLSIFQDEDDGTGCCSLLNEFGRETMRNAGFETRYMCTLLFAHANDDFDGTCLIFYGKFGSGHVAVSNRVYESRHWLWVRQRHGFSFDSEAFPLDSEKRPGSGVETPFDPSATVVRWLMRNNFRIFVIQVEQKDMAQK